jgi:hypothetical protein
MDWIGCGRSQSWPNLKCPGTWKEGSGKQQQQKLGESESKCLNQKLRSGWISDLILFYIQFWSITSYSNLPSDSLSLNIPRELDILIPFTNEMKSLRSCCISFSQLSRIDTLLTSYAEYSRFWKCSPLVHLLCWHLQKKVDIHTLNLFIGRT